MIKKIVVLGTGGTIAGTATNPADNIGYAAAQLGVDQLLAAIPALQETLAGRSLVAEQVAQIDSKDMSFEVWQTLAQRAAFWLADAAVQGIVVTHGTDTLEETAYFLHAALAPALTAAKPLVLTCAMRPATALQADGPQNLLDAVAVAATPGALGVVVVCAGCIHGARDVQKTHTYRLNAFSSGDAGPLGYVEEGRVRQLRDWPVRAAYDVFEPGPTAAAGRVLALRSSAGSRAWPRVEIVMSYAGAGAALVDALVAQGVQGLVLAGTGNGTVHHELETALLRAQDAGVKVVRASRCSNGRVLARSRDRIPDSHGLSPVKARVALMLALLDPPVADGPA